MKTFKIPLAVLIALVALALANAAILTRQCRAWQQQTEKITELAAQEQWTQAENALEALYASWERWDGFLRMTTAHSEVEEVDTMIEECRVLLEQQNRDTLSLYAVQMNCQFSRLSELQTFSLSNLL